MAGAAGLGGSGFSCSEQEQQGEGPWRLPLSAP